MYLIALLLFACTGAPTPHAPGVSGPRDGPDVDRRAEATLGVPHAWHEAAGVRYLELTLGSAGEDAPVLVALHGRGSSPLRFGMFLHELQGKARVLLPEGSLPAGEDRAWLRTALNGPPENLAGDLTAEAERLAPWLDEVAPDAPVLIGWAQGGMIAATLALKHPGRVGQAWMAGGLLPEPVLASASASASPVHVLVGADDALVTPQQARATHEALTAAGVTSSFTEVADVGHRMHTPMFTDAIAPLGLHPAPAGAPPPTQMAGPDGLPGQGSKAGPDGEPVEELPDLPSTISIRKVPVQE